MDFGNVDSLRLLADIADKNPSLFNTPSRDGYARGIEYYSARAFVTAFTKGLNKFFKAHGRAPNLVVPESCADHFFRMKFFGFIPMPPNPADKLNVLKFVSEERAGSVTRPKIVWVSDKPILPKNDEVPEGDYYLKASNGSAMQAKVKWPIDQSMRQNLEQKCRKWLARNYGLHWGEWWYAASPQKLFMEEDLSGRIISEVTFKIFVRQGRVKLIRAIDSLRRLECFFDPNLEKVHGNSHDCTPLEMTLPNNMPDLLSAAGDIGRRFDIARIDLYHSEDLPIIGEITLCHTNAMSKFMPREFDDFVRKSLFE